MFALFSIAITAIFFISSLVLVNFGRRLGLRHLRQESANGMAGLATVEGAIFALIGVLVAFTVSGALQRFDERRQTSSARRMIASDCSNLNLLAASSQN